MEQNELEILYDDYSKYTECMKCFTATDDDFIFASSDDNSYSEYSDYSDR